MGDNKTNLFGTLINGGIDLLGNFLGYKSNKNTNKSNYEIAQMNNQFNEKMLQKQMDYNTDMWNKQNAYNTPEQQRKRFEAAGLNPYMMLGNIQAGQAGSVGGVNPPTAQPVTMQPFQPDFSGLGQAVQSYVANRIVEKRNNASIAVDDAKAEQIRIENDYKAAELVSQIMERLENTRNVKAKRIYQSIMNNYAEEQFSSDIKFKNRQIESIEADIRSKNVDIAIKQFELDGLPKQFQLQLAAMSADVLLAKAQTKMSNAQAKTELQKMYKTFFETKGIKINNRILERSADSIVEKADKENKATYWNTASGIVGPIASGLLGFGLGRLGHTLDTRGGRKIVTYQKLE